MPEEKHAILSGVQSLTFLYYDGTQWDPTWDTTQQTNLPLAIKVQIQMAARNPAAWCEPAPGTGRARGHASQHQPHHGLQ